MKKLFKRKVQLFTLFTANRKRFLKLFTTSSPQNKYKTEMNKFYNDNLTIPSFYL